VSERGRQGRRSRCPGRSAEAIEQFEKAIALDQELGGSRNQCLKTSNFADLYANLGENAQARRLAEAALKLARQTNFRLIECAATTILADLMIREGRLEEALELYDRVRTIADETNAIQFQMAARGGLALAHLLAGDLPLARGMAAEAARHRYPNGYGRTLLLEGVIALRQGDAMAAGRAFDKALREAETLLAGAARDYQSAYTKALALAGLAIARDPALGGAAAEGYRDARAISAAPGVVVDALLLLDALAASDPDEVLKPVRAAAAGEP
jgi:tetratricopeptide (TPR) repeat protein